LSEARRLLLEVLKWRSVCLRTFFSPRSLHDWSNWKMVFKLNKKQRFCALCSENNEEI
jgi:hypothetical protein